MEPEEIERLLRVFNSMTEWETRNFIFLKRRGTRGFTRTFSVGLGLDVSARYETTLINQLQAHLSDVRAGLVDDPTFECVGCGGTSEAKGLRWDKINKGQPLTISVDHSAKPASLGWLTSEEILANWAEPWAEKNPKIKFQLLSVGVGDCHIKWERIDGPGNTLAFVWQPSGSTEEMADAGALSGDMVCDSSERTYPKALVHEAGKHEFGHVLGIGHGKSPVDVMFPTAKGEFKPLSKSDLSERNSRYPTK